MRLSQCLYGRSEDKKYNFEKYSADYAMPGFRVEDWVRGSIRDSSLKYGVLELKSLPSIMDARKSDTTLCYSEFVMTKDVADPSSGERKTVDTRAYGYSHYVLLPSDRFAEENISPRDALRISTELLLADNLFLDKHSYQVQTNSANALPCVELSQEEITQMYRQKVQKRAEQIRSKRFSSDASSEDREIVAAAFGEDNLAAFLARYWEFCWRKFVQKSADSLPLLATPAELYDPEQPECIKTDGIIFFHDYVVPHLPEAVIRMASISFGNLAGQPSAQLDNAAMVCYPTQAAYNSACVYCPFEDSVYDEELERKRLLLGHAIIKNTLPESYRLLAEHPDGAQAAMNFDIVCNMVELEDLISELCTSTINPAENGRFVFERLEMLNAELNAYGIVEAADRMKILYPLYLSAVQICIEVKPTYDPQLFACWIEHRRMLEESRGALTEQQMETLTKLFDDMLSYDSGMLNGGPLSMLASANAPLFEQAEEKLCATLVGMPSESLQKEWLVVYLRRMLELELQNHLQTAQAYNQLIFASLKLSVREESLAACMRWTANRRAAFVSGRKTVEMLAEDLWKDRTCTEELQRICSGHAQLDDDRFAAFLQQYVCNSSDAELRPVWENALHPLMIRLLQETGNMTPSRAALVSVYTTSGWINPEADELILSYVDSVSFESLVRNPDHLLRKIYAAFFEGHRHDPLLPALGARLCAKADEVDYQPQLSDVKAVLTLPCDNLSRCRILRSIFTSLATVHEELSAQLVQEIGRVLSGQREALEAAQILQARFSMQSSDQLQQRIPQLLQFVSDALMDTDSASIVLCNCFESLMPLRFPHEQLCSALEKTLGTVHLNADRLADSVRIWAGRTVRKQLEEKDSGHLPECEEIIQMDRLLRMMQVPLGEVLHKPLLARCSEVIFQNSSYGGIPSVDEMDAVSKLLKACGISEAQRHALFVDVFKSSLEKRPGELSEAYNEQLKSICELSGVRMSELRAPNLVWLKRVIAEKRDGVSGLPDEAWMEDLYRRTMELDLAPSELKRPLIEWYRSFLQNAISDELPTESLYERIQELCQHFDADPAAFSAELTCWISHVVLLYANRCLEAKRLPEPGWLNMLKNHCQQHGLEWNAWRTQLVELCTKVLGFQKDEMVDVAFLRQLKSCDDVLEIDLRSRSAILKDWMKKSVDEQDKTVLPNEELLDAIEFACGEYSLQDRALCMALMDWMEHVGIDPLQNPKKSMMQRIVRSNHIHCTDDAVPTRTQWLIFFYCEKERELVGLIAGSVGVAALLDLAKSETVQEYEQLLQWSDGRKGDGELQEILLSCFEQDEQLQQPEKLRQLLGRPIWAQPVAGFYLTEVKKAFDEYLRTHASDLLSLALQENDVSMQVEHLYLWDRFLTRHSEWNSDELLRQVRLSCVLLRRYDEMGVHSAWIIALQKWLDSRPELPARSDFTKAIEVYGLEKMQGLDGIGRTIPLLIGNLRMTQQEIAIDWESYLNSAFPLKNQKPWANVDLWNSDVCAYLTLSALMRAIQPIDSLYWSLIRYLDEIPWGKRMKKQARKKLPRLKMMDGSGNPILGWLSGEY